MFYMKQFKNLLGIIFLSFTLLITYSTLSTDQTAEASAYWNGDYNFQNVQEGNPNVYIDKSSCCVVEKDSHSITIAFNLVNVYASGQTEVYTCYIRGYDGMKQYKINKDGSWMSMFKNPTIQKANTIARNVLGIVS